MINKQRLIKTARDLIRINSENPPGNEKAAAEYIKKELSSSGIRPINMVSFKPARLNVLATVKGSKPGRALLLSPHIDTVPAGKGWKYDPFAAVVKNGRLYGRGASDCKGNLAVCMEVLRSIKEEKIKLEYDVIMAATADEETGSKLGIIELLKKKILRPAYALILDSDNFKVIAFQKGLIHLRVRIFGKKAHGAYPDMGVNAVEQAARIISSLNKLKFKSPEHRFLKPLTINTGTITGGDKVNIVADFCEFSLDIRFLPKMDPDEIIYRIRQLVKAHAERSSIIIDSVQKPYEISLAHAFIKCILNSDKHFKLSGSEGATVITFFQDFNIPALATGFGSEGTAHTNDEYVKVGDLYNGALALEKFVVSFDKHVGR